MQIHIRRVSVRLFTTLFCAVLINAPASATPNKLQKTKNAACQLTKIGSSNVTKIISGHTVELADGRRVRLLALHVPKNTFDSFSATSSRTTGTAKVTLENSVLGKTVEIHKDQFSEDRYGRILAHLFILRGHEKLWLQRILVENGLAQVSSFADNRACIRRLLEFEAKARQNNLGLWQTGQFGLKRATQIKKLLAARNSFQIVEGTIRKSADVRGRIFLNYGANWRTDFTVTVAKKDRRHFRKSPIDLIALAGKRLRVRGWVEYWNGPVIKVTHPEQIEILPGPHLVQPTRTSDAPSLSGN